MKFREFAFLSISLVLVFFLFGIIHTSKVEAISTESILVDMAPENPAPNENVNINLNSYLYDLDTVLITWSVDGKSVLSGIGKRSFSTRAGGAGSEVVVTITINLPEGAAVKNISIRPSMTVLLWQATDSFVPPFYRGRALPSSEGEIKIVAMPEIKIGSVMANPKNMVYSWQKDYTNDTEGSGYGKNSFIFSNDYLDDVNNVTVTASTIDQQHSSQASVNIKMTDPKILFYKNDPVFGTNWDNTLADPHKINGSEIIAAMPYFISPKDLRNPMLVWSWFINDYQVTMQDFRENLMPLRTEGNASGTSKVKLQVENKYKLTQTVSGDINVEF